MYVTRHLSVYRNSPELLSAPPPEGPGSGILVLAEEADETLCCLGVCKDPCVEELPFPQNKKLTLAYRQGNHTDYYQVALIPVLNQPLSSNHYYPIRDSGTHKGEADMNSKEEDKVPCLCFMVVQDAKPQALDPTNIYQRVEITPTRRKGAFTAKSVASDGYPPDFLRRSGWTVFTETTTRHELGEALGLSHSLRARLPRFESSTAVVIGKWYCPFMFVHEEKMKVKEQVSKTMFYEMSLEQRWVKVMECKGEEREGNEVCVDVVVETQVGFVGGVEAKWGAREVVDGVVWLGGVGLGGEIVERMVWEEERFEWVGGGEDRQVRLERVYEFGLGGSSDKWVHFGCYVLQERFVLKRMDGSLVLTQDFKNISHVRCKWERGFRKS